MYKILVLEDDELFASTVEDFLSDEGFEVDIAFDGEECLELNFKKNYDFDKDIVEKDVKGDK